MSITPRCSACRTPFAPKPGAKNRRCPGCQGKAKVKVKVRTLSAEDRMAGWREANMMSRGRSVPSCGEG